MSKVVQVAWREFIVTVTSKAFLLGLLLVPVIGILMAWAMPKLFASSNFAARGSIALIDPDGRVSERLRAELDPDTVTLRREAATARALEQMPPEARALVGTDAVEQVVPSVELTLDERPAPANIDAEKAC